MEGVSFNIFNQCPFWGKLQFLIQILWPYSAFSMTLVGIILSIVDCIFEKLSKKNILGKTKTNILIYTAPILPLGRKKHKNID